MKQPEYENNGGVYTNGKVEYGAFGKKLPAGLRKRKRTKVNGGAYKINKAYRNYAAYTETVIVDKVVGEVQSLSVKDNFECEVLKKINLSAETVEVAPVKEESKVEIQEETAIEDVTVIEEVANEIEAAPSTEKNVEDEITVTAQPKDEAFECIEDDIVLDIEETQEERVTLQADENTEENIETVEVAENVQETADTDDVDVVESEEDEAEQEVSPEEVAMFAEEEETVEQADTDEATKEERKRAVEQLAKELAVPPRRKYIAAPTEIPVVDEEYTVEIPTKNLMKENVQSVFKALVKEGVKLGYLDKYDGLSPSEIKEEYEGEYVYEVAEQELKKISLGIVTVGKEQKVAVYAFGWDGLDIHHLGYINQQDKAQALIPYIQNKDEYIFNTCGVITGGKFKSVEKDEASGKIKIKNCDGLPYGIELDITVYKKTE